MVWRYNIDVALTNVQFRQNNALKIEEIVVCSTTNEKLFKNFERLLSDNYLSGNDVRLNFELAWINLMFFSENTNCFMWNFFGKFFLRVSKNNLYQSL